MKIDLDAFDTAIEAAGDGSTDWDMEDSVPAFNLLTTIRDEACLPFDISKRFSDHFRRGRLFTLKEVQTIVNMAKLEGSPGTLDIILDLEERGFLQTEAPNRDQVGTELSIHYADEAEEWND